MMAVRFGRWHDTMTVFKICIHDIIKQKSYAQGATTAVTTAARDRERLSAAGETCKVALTWPVLTF